VRLLSGTVFTLGLILVIVGGAELFTGNNLIPVKIGNIIGGAVMVGVVYWFIYLHKDHVTISAASAISAAPVEKK
jgi:formate/nitrite transporter FocA (FNT family)